MRFDQIQNLDKQSCSNEHSVRENVRPSNQEIHNFFASKDSKEKEPEFLDFGTSVDLYGDDDESHLRWAGSQTVKTEVGVAHFRRNDNDIAGQVKEWVWNDSAHMPEQIVSDCKRLLDAIQQHLAADSLFTPSMPFADSGKTLQPTNPSSWTLPTKENFSGWMPGDPINPNTWAEDSSKYIQEIMKQNFVVDSNGKRVSVFNLEDNDFKARFGNAVRHALGIGDLVFYEGMKPADAFNGMWWHEPASWITGAVLSAVKLSSAPYEHNIKDSHIDIANNRFAVQQISKFHDFDSFARKMLSDGWNSAKKGTGPVGVPLGTK